MSGNNLENVIQNVDYAGDEVLYVTLSPETAQSGGEYFVQRKPTPIFNYTPRIQKSKRHS